MQIKKATLHIGRLKGKSNGRHNDRSFDTSKNESIIHPEDACENRYYISDEEGKFLPVEANKNSFENRERQFYKEHFSQSLKAKNDRYKSEGHKEKCKTMTQLRKGQRTAPNEIILQVGSEKNPYMKQETFRKMVQIMVTKIRKEYPQFKILNWAIHCDETSMHCHIRGVFVSKDRDGYEEPNQSKALREMGFEKPEPDKDTSKNNNEMVTFTDQLRTEWYDTIEMIDPELSIDREVTNPNQKHQKTKKKEIEKLEEIKYGLEQKISNLNNILLNTKDKLKSSDYEKLNALEQFIDEKNLQSEFEDFYENIFDLQYEY